MGKQKSLTCLHVNQTDRKLIILVPFLVKIASFTVLCWENCSPLAAPLAVHARRAQFARSGWKHSDKVQLLGSGWMHSPRLTAQPGDHVCNMDWQPASNSWQSFPGRQWKGERSEFLVSSVAFVHHESPPFSCFFPQHPLPVISIRGCCEPGVCWAMCHTWTPKKSITAQHTWAITQLDKCTPKPRKINHPSTALCYQDVCKLLAENLNVKYL